ncbi:hypothetical protein GH714_028959 [Hevea brasiliensis]|uniref:Uncharacterized protein n=1 Tax=Hevea brasiliensis TaxID=3981 RepID=A0A6A6NJV1_HEVBR|nr:hypothetical protein GH714_028959 [Hevea brasiliensis]
MDDIKEDARETVNTIQGELHKLKGKVNLLIRATSNPIMGSYEVGNTKIPEPKAFGGARDAKELNMQEDTGKIKAVNSKATNIVGVTRRVSCQMGSWNGEIDFTVIPLDDFDVVIEMEFLKKARAIPIPIADCLLLMGDKPCIVPTSFSPLCEKKLIASLQFTRSAKSTEPTRARDKHEIMSCLYV